MFLGACGLKKRILALTVGLCAAVSFLSCGRGYGGSSSSAPSRLTERVVASQGVTNTTTFGGLQIIDGQNDTIAPLSPLSPGSSPSLMAISPTRNIVAAFDANRENITAIDTIKESEIGPVTGGIHIGGQTTSMIVPIASPIAYAAVPSTVINGFAFHGAVAVVNFSTGALSTIAVPNAQTVVANANATQLLVFSNDSDSIYIVSPGLALPPVDTSCANPATTMPATCVVVSGFDRPVFAIISGSTAYVLNCGPQCGGTQAGIAVLDLSTLTITQTIPVEAATTALLSGSTMYVAGTPPTNNACTGQTTAATTCGRLDVVDLGSGTVTSSAVITDGYHQRMDLTINGQIFIGSKDCTNVGNVGNPVPGQEIRGCLSIYKVADGSVLIPPDNGDVNGFQGFTTRYVEYVAEGGNLRVYDITRDVLLINDFVPQGSINIPGYIGDVKAIDFF